MIRRIPAAPLFALVFAATVQADAPGASPPVERLLEVSGFDAQLVELPAQIKTGLGAGMINALADPGAGAELEALAASVDDAFDPAPHRAALVADLREALTDAQAGALLDWYDSALGRRLTAAEVAAASPEAMEDVAQAVPELMTDAERVARAQRMARVNDITDFVVDQQRRTVLATAMLVAEIGAPAEAPDLDALADQLDAMAPMMRLQVMQQMQVSHLYTYRDFSLEEIDTYIGFLETQASRTWTAMAMAAVAHISQDIVDGMLEDLGVRLRGRSHRRERDAA